MFSFLRFERYFIGFGTKFYIGQDLLGFISVKILIKLDLYQKMAILAHCAKPVAAGRTRVPYPLFQKTSRCDVECVAKCFYNNVVLCTASQYTYSSCQTHSGLLPLGGGIPPPQSFFGSWSSRGVARFLSSGGLTSCFTPIYNP